MPFCCGKRSAGICVVLGSKNPQRIPANTPPVFSSLRPRICRHLLFLATKDYSDRLLGWAIKSFYIGIVAMSALPCRMDGSEAYTVLYPAVRQYQPE